MRLSVKSQYALESLIAIGIDHRRQGSQPVSIRDLAASRGIPERFLGQILSTLCKAGLLASVRGVRGGYLLARSPADIPIGEAVRALEGSLAPVLCVCEVETGEASCLMSELCVTRELWQDIAYDINHTLDDISLEDLLLCTEIPQGRVSA